MKPVETVGMSNAPILRQMSTINAQSVAWLWPNRIPLGRLTLLVGRPGEGKSFFTMELAAHVSTGRTFPDGRCCTFGTTIIVSAEDDPADTIRPRLDASEADVNKVYVLSGVTFTESNGTKSERAFTLADVPSLELALQTHPDCKLVVIDPIGSYLGGGTDAHRDNEVRSVLSPIAELASRFGVAIVMVAHRRKGSGDFADDSALGSRAFTGIARAVWHLSRDPEDKQRRLLLPGKNNLTSEGDGLAFRIEGTPGRIFWEDGPVTMTADDAQHAEVRAAAERRKPGPSAVAREQATKWLQEQLAEGPKTPADVRTDAENAGHKWRTVERAAKELEVVSDRSGFGGGTQWRLPGPTSLDNSAPARQVTQEGENVATWRECENPAECADFGTTNDVPAKSPDCGGTRRKPIQKRSTKETTLADETNGSVKRDYPQPTDGRLFPELQLLPD